MTDKKLSSLLLKNQRRKFTSEFKSKVVLEAITEKQSLAELADKFDIDSNQIAEWKRKFLSKAHLIFDLEDPENNASSAN